MISPACLTCCPPSPSWCPGDCSKAWTPIRVCLRERALPLIPFHLPSQRLQLSLEAWLLELSCPAKALIRKCLKYPQPLSWLAPHSLGRGNVSHYAPRREKGRRGIEQPIGCHPSRWGLLEMLPLSCTPEAKGFCSFKANLVS